MTHMVRQCSQIQKIEWASKPKIENYYILQKLKLHPLNRFHAFKSLTNKEKHVIKGIYAQMAKH